MGNSESDIAIEEFDPFNSHALIEHLMGVDPQYTQYEDCRLYQQIITSLWPELMQWPINPPHSIRESVASMIGQIGLGGLVKGIRYWVHAVRYRLGQ